MKTVHYRGLAAGELLALQGNPQSALTWMNIMSGALWFDNDRGPLPEVLDPILEKHCGAAIEEYMEALRKIAVGEEPAA